MIATMDGALVLVSFTKYKIQNMLIPEHFTKQLSLKEQILFVLSILKKATADEVAIELMELKGVATEEGVANLTIEVKNELKKMQEAHILKELTEADKQVRYCIK